jgi:threonine dehydrogenase-like Zn-dependent dehydrogenase
VKGAFRPIAHLPDSVDEVTASLYEPLSCALRIATRLPTAPGSRVLVLGLGTMGVFAGLLLKHDVSDVELVGADTNLFRVDFARRMGFHAAVQIVPGETASLCAQLGDFDVVIDATGVAAVFPVAVELARLGGNVILGGVPTDTTPFAPLPIFRKELTVVGAKGPFPFTDGRGRDRVVELLASDHLPWRALVSPTPFGDARGAFRSADRGDSLKSVLTLDQ